MQRTVTVDNTELQALYRQIAELKDQIRNRDKLLADERLIPLIKNITRKEIAAMDDEGFFTACPKDQCQGCDDQCGQPVE